MLFQVGLVLDSYKDYNDDDDDEEEEDNDDDDDDRERQRDIYFLSSTFIHLFSYIQHHNID